MRWVRQAFNFFKPDIRRPEYQGAGDQEIKAPGRESSDTEKNPFHRTSGSSRLRILDFWPDTLIS